MNEYMNNERIQNVWIQTIREQDEKIKTVCERVRELEQSIQNLEFLLKFLTEGSLENTESGDFKNSVDENSEFENSAADEQFSFNHSNKKPRVVWSTLLHKDFVRAIDMIGFDNAVPTKILKIMNTMGHKNLRRENIASHLQKYRECRVKTLKEKQGNTSDVVQNTSSGDAILNNGSSMDAILNNVSSINANTSSGDAILNNGSSINANTSYGDAILNNDSSINANGDDPNTSCLDAILNQMNQLTSLYRNIDDVGNPPNMADFEQRMLMQPNVGNDQIFTEYPPNIGDLAQNVGNHQTLMQPMSSYNVSNPPTLISAMSSYNVSNPPHFDFNLKQEQIPDSNQILAQPMISSQPNFGNNQMMMQPMMSSQSMFTNMEDFNLQQDQIPNKQPMISSQPNVGNPSNPALATIFWNYAGENPPELLIP